MGDNLLRSFALVFSVGAAINAIGLLLDWSEGAIGAAVVLAVPATLVAEDVLVNGWSLRGRGRGVPR